MFIVSLLPHDGLETKILIPRSGEVTFAVAPLLYCFDCGLCEHRQAALDANILHGANRGGMLYQFLGDGVLAIFGLFDPGRPHSQTALACARSLIQIGKSVTNEWQRQIDHIQSSSGSHVGIARGDMQFMSLRPFSRTHIGAIGDSINLAARLCSAAEVDEIVVSNTFYQWLSRAARAEFQETQPVDAKNMGRVRTWKLKCGV